MPLSTDKQVLETSQGLVDVLRTAAGPHPGFRPAHARGHLLTGTFTPTPEASTLTTAPHFTNPTTPLTLRFSSSTGLPTIPDTDPQANPRGLGLRFHLPDTPSGRRAHTDIIAHSTRYFPTRTGADFLEFLRAATGPDAGTLVPQFLGAHPETARFLGEKRESPVSFGTEAYFGVNAFKFVGGGGKETFVRYRVVPVAGVQTLGEDEVKTKGESYLYDELPKRLEGGAVEFKLLVQVAQEGDVTDDATVLWPEERELVELGTIKVEKVLREEESLAEQKKIIFDPVPRVEGVEASKDPLLDVRANVYLISGRQRREA
ncbi:catalase domain-containing protein [Corynespora cassiicola Philippines]|uniref:Catalase domain-containing protein n=1 Tax=Corynespora cassiicola Philippines TaxID=1448308 RepID=A0A2T2NCP2_CORCC|nr:catalase domain-containing protein [Corynespora cassiicola Philippines]